ncbi:MAG: hypothetical protein ACR2RB_09850, partial [Gammaproteobacteria bacterium]
MDKAWKSPPHSCATVGREILGLFVQDFTGKVLTRISHHDDGAGLIFDSTTHFLLLGNTTCIPRFRKCLVKSNLCA